ncbi:MAG TPA: sensor histidine kinase, partial [Chitinophagaceae bacterium]|nr:sensor histidine kinase [Chitinophagaceae bacterium]
LNNFSQSLKDCDTSLKYADIADNDDRRARVLQTIGSVYYQQQSYEQSAEYYEKAFQLYQKIGNQQMSAIVLNNQGNTFKHLGYYDKSIASFTKAIAIGNSLNDLNNLSMYHENLSDAYLASGNISEAEKQGVTALKYAVQQANSLQLANAYECLGSVYLKQQKFAAAIESGLKAYDFAKEAKDVSIQYEITDLLAEAYSKSGNHAKAFEFLTISKNINDSLTRQQFDEDVSALQTKFKVDEKDKEIQLLNKDKELQSQKLTQQRILLIASIMLAFLAIGSIFLLINRSRLRQQMKELELRNQIAADLHDEVGSSLSSIHMLSQIANKKQSEDASQKEILDRMSVNVKETMDKMGDIVWMIKPGEGEGISLKNRMERFAQEVCSSKNIDLNMELGKLETMKLSMPQRKNLYLIFKEALNNAAKYSGTEKIDISIKEENKRLSFMLKDHGKGFDASRIAKGNGLDNMQNRARELNGELKINSAMDEGTIIQLDMPV